MKKIVISTNSSWNIYNFRSEFIELLSQFYEVHILTPENSYKKFLKENIYTKWHLVPFKNKSTSILENIFLIFKYYIVLKNINPDVYISYTIKPNLFGIISLLFRRSTSIILNITGLGSIFTDKRFYFYKSILILTYKILKKRVNFVIVQNKSDQNYFVRNNIFDIKQIILISSSGVDTTYFSSKNLVKKKEKYKFLFLSRIKAEKGIGLYLDAIAKFSNNKHNVADFYIAGEFDQNIKLKNYVLNSIIKNKNIYYLGVSNNSKILLDEYDVFVLPSIREGTSKGLLEAMSMQRIVIGSNKPGINNLIKHNFNGLIMKRYDADSLSKEFERVYNLNTQEINEITFNARKFIIDNYHVSIINKKLLNIVQGLT